MAAAIARLSIFRSIYALTVAASLICSCSAKASDLALTTLFDGERTGQLGASQFLNNWGGAFSAGNIAGVTRDANVSHSGGASIRANLGTISPGGFGFFQAFASQTANSSLRQTRDLTRYSDFETYVRNDTGATLNLKYEIKDYRDSNAHRAYYNFTVPAGAGWTRLSAPLDVNSAGWIVAGTPDLSRTYVTSFVVTPQSGGVSGSIYLDDFKLRERGAAIDLQTATIRDIAERLAERQFSGLWMARNRATGLIYNTSNDANVAAMNTTGGVLWMLPSAVRRGWVTQSDADAFAAQVADSLNSNLNLAAHVPTRFINPATAGLPEGANEESSIDASFIALALHRYKTQPTTSTSLRTLLDAVQNRFKLDAFATPDGFRLAYLPASGFTSGTYDGYTNEGKTISLAAEVSDAHHVPLESLWNSDTHRSRVFLVNADDAHLTHSLSQFRAPFEQALLNLFVDTSDRGVDNYPNRSLATNPWQNFVRYERETAAKLAQLGRPEFFQPDAGDGGTGGYQQYSLYNNFGQADLFMPWSVSFALLAGAPGAEEALRTLLDEGNLHGPLGIADSARWATGASTPSNIPASQDNWNVVLSTMALLEYLEGEQRASRNFADLAAVRAALDKVFVDDDLDGRDVVGAADLSIWNGGFGEATGTPPANGGMDGTDFLRSQVRIVAQSCRFAVQSELLHFPQNLGRLAVRIGLPAP